MTYTLISGSSSVIRDADGAFIPDDTANVDWQAYQTWLEQDNTPTPAPGPTVAQQVATALGAGITITCTGNSSLNGVYATDQVAVLRLTSTAQAISGSVIYPTLAGVNKTFTSTQFANLSIAVIAYVNALNVIITANSGSLPAATATIP